MRPKLFSSRLVFAFALSLTTAFLHAAPGDTNLLGKLRSALTPVRGAAWGEVQVGTRSVINAPPAPEVLAAGKLLKAALPAAPRGPAAAPEPGAAQQEAVRLLRQASASPVHVYLRAENQTIAQIRGSLQNRVRAAAATDAADAEQTSITFLQRHRNILRLDDPERELRLDRQHRDGTGERHLRYTQIYRGLPVWPSGLAVHLDRAGNVALVDGAYIPTPRPPSVRPQIDAADAIARAKQSVRGGSEALTTEPSLIVYAPLRQAPRLAWKFDLNVGFLSAWRFVVDAENGALLSRVSQICEVNVAGSGPDLSGTLRNLNVWSQGGRFYLADSSKRMFDAASDPIGSPRGVISVFDARNVALKDLQTVHLMESSAANDWLADGVSALFNFSRTYDYFSSTFNRNSLDGNGGNIQAVVRIADMDNAFWNGNLGMMFFGTVRPYPLALDVVGHELAHGVIQHSADLVYELQPGALNESFADIFGEMVELRSEGSTTWKLGEQLGKVFRDFKEPGSLQIGGLDRPYPSKMSEFLDLPNTDDADHGGVHLNSSIINHCFYLLAEGLPNAIGAQDAEKIFYRCLTLHLQKQSQFIDTRLGCIAAAESLFGVDSTQARRTAEAFDRVEIFARPATPEPTELPPVAGEDATLLLTLNPLTQLPLLARSEAGLGDPAGGIILADAVTLGRPSVSGDGSLAVYVNASNDLCVIATDDATSAQCIGLPGRIHSAAISPDGEFAAFVLIDTLTGQVENQLSVFEFATDTVRTFQLLAPVIDGSPVDNVLHADSLVFSSDSKRLIYDAISEIRFGNNSSVARWSIFSINLPTESTSVLVPPLADANFGNPNLGRAGNRYLVFDAQDSTTGNGIIITMDLFTGEVAQVGNVGAGIGYPSFTGDETAVIYAARDPNASFNGYSLIKQSLTPDRLAVSGPATDWMADTRLGVLYRRGAFVSSNQPPTVHISAPAANASFPSATPITIEASAADSNGSVSKVGFYDGSILLGEDATAPYQLVWTNPPAGPHRLIARATDDLGASGDSNPIPITVGASARHHISVSVIGNTVRLTLQGDPGSYVIQRSSNLADWTNEFPVILDGGGMVPVDDPLVSGARFYRSKRQ